MAIACVSYFDRLDNSKKCKHVSSNLGSEFKTVYEYRVVDGIDTLVPTGQKNIDDEIQSHLMEANINVIIAKFLNGDLSVLNQSKGMFGDFRNCPTTYADMFDRVRQCENMFDALPVEIKAKFDNSYKKFWSDFGSDHFNSVFDEFNVSVEDTSVKQEGEVKDAE